MNISPRRPIFTRRSESSVYRMFFWAILALGGIWLILQMRQGDIKSPFEAAPTPTRTANSYALEGDANFSAGKLDDAILAYQQGVKVEPNNAELWAKLARIQTYSSALLTTDAEQSARLKDALASARQAVAFAPDDSLAHAILAFALDWNANPVLVDNNQVQAYLTEAQQEAVRSLQLDNTNTLALAFFAEILVDQQQWTQAEQNITQALAQDPSLMDVHRVYAYVLEAGGEYNQAIQEYDKAVAIAPKLTFLYLRAGANYRRLAFDSPNPETQTQLFEKSLEYFAQAAKINQQLAVKDPTPYLSIAKTYSQTGDYFAAARNAQKALEFQPGNADIYGQLGVIFFKSRNYEGSIPILKCAIRGCTPQESCQARYERDCKPENGEISAQVNVLPLSLSSIDYYQVYFSVLAALGPRDPTYCPEALNIINEIQTQGADILAKRPDIAENIAVAQQECSTTTESPPATGTPLPVTPGTGVPTSTLDINLFGTTVPYATP
ncbi:MAG: tetratricopeptide repeat protein [Chloroflexi bacterium]|nr:tetratricopeptide repeat protein [Chloroflexota bacterium]MBI3338520.1 tetratricopeptide repeat protein [Chloroflexota bacterium]